MDEPTQLQTPPIPERRCWRCLQMFPGDPTEPVTRSAPGWWLCDPCAESLIGSQRRAS